MAAATCVLDAGPLASISAWVEFYERYWQERLDALDGLLGDEQTADEKG